MILTSVGSPAFAGATLSDAVDDFRSCANEPSEPPGRSVFAADRLQAGSSRPKLERGLQIQVGSDVLAPRREQLCDLHHSQDTCAREQAYRPAIVHYDDLVDVLFRQQPQPLFEWIVWR